MADEEGAVRLAAGLEQLSPPQREVVFARLIDGQSFEEISSRLGAKKGALRVLFCRAIKQLRTLLESQE